MTSIFVLPSAEKVMEFGHNFPVPRRSETILLGLARALAASPMWFDMPEGILVFRATPSPVLAILGKFDDAARQRIEKLGQYLHDTLAQTRYVGYLQAEEDCERLAIKLIERFGWEELHHYHFDAIPRGGLIVLGMLAYLLKLKHEQLRPPHPDNTPLVVVDDCVLSGARFSKYLGGIKSQQVILASLYAHPELRNAIEAKEPSVMACISAHDLHDYAPGQLGDNHSSWLEYWSRRLDGPRYWIGQPEHVCFAWSEPDRAFWNPVTKQVEAAWRIVPPDLCLKNRPVPGAEPTRVQIQPEGKGPLKPSAAVIYGDLEGQIFVGDMKVGKSLCLEGTAASIWRSIVKYGNLRDVAVAISQEYEVEEDVLNSNLHGFVSELLACGLLEHEYTSSYAT